MNCHCVHKWTHSIENGVDIFASHVAGDVSGGRGCRGPRGAERGCWPLVAAPATTTTGTAGGEPLSFHLICRGGQPAGISLPCVASRPVARSEQRVCGRDAAPSPPAGAAQQGNRTAAARTTPSPAPVCPSDLLQHLLPQPVVHGGHPGCTDTELKFGFVLHYKICFQNLCYLFLFIVHMMTSTADGIVGMVSVRTTSCHSNSDSDTDSRAHKMVLTSMRNSLELSAFTLRFVKILICSLKWHQFHLTENSSIFSSQFLMCCFNNLVSSISSVAICCTLKYSSWNGEEITCIARSRVHIRL